MRSFRGIDGKLYITLSPMRFYLDTEFIEEPGTIDLISIALVAEDGTSLYCECSEFDAADANQFVRDKVLPNLTEPEEDRLTKHEIAEAVLEFVNRKRGNKKPEFWGYYADYDWVVFCWLFGPMIDLPVGFPMYCHDLKQELDNRGNPKVPIPKSETHNALDDARWIKAAHEWLESL